jgi:hypothetical protein
MDFIGSEQPPHRAAANWSLSMKFASTSFANAVGA